MLYKIIDKNFMACWIWSRQHQRVQLNNYKHDPK